MLWNPLIMRYRVCDAAFAVSLRRRRRIDGNYSLSFFFIFGIFGGAFGRILIASHPDVGYQQMRMIWNPLIMLYRVCDAALAVSLRRRRRIDGSYVCVCVFFFFETHFFLTKAIASLFQPHHDIPTMYPAPRTCHTL